MPQVPKTVLVVDDVPQNRYVVCRILREAKYKTLEARTGKEAVGQARLHKPDAIVLDMHLPDQTGVDVLKELRSLEKTCSIPVVILNATAHSSYNLANAEEHGAAAYLFSPVVPETLVHVVSGIIERANQ